jgi:hypothetical protein
MNNFGMEEIFQKFLPLQGIFSAADILIVVKLLLIY